MITKFNFLLAAAMVAMLATSCSEEQTSLTIDEITTTAKIVGQVSYQTGTEWDATTSTVKNKYAVAVNKKVIIEIDNSELKSGAQGITVYETATDAKGNYEIAVPIVGASMGVTIKAETFNDDMKTYDGMTAAEPIKPVYKTENYTYSYATITKVNSATMTVVDMQYVPTLRAPHIN